MHETLLGIDLGFTSFGMCKIEVEHIKRKIDFKSIESFSFKIKDRKLKKEEKHVAFIQEVMLDPNIIEMIKDARFVSIENPYNMPGRGRNLIQLLGIVKLYCIDFKKPYIEIPQKTLKKFATSTGNAEKSKMVMKAFKEFNFEADTEDEVDAMWCCVVGLCMLYPSIFSVARRDSLKRIQIYNND
jgi:Holliday junction resolvasome RuvABC endonuclease subunit